jgi:UDP-4-amino-4,6-dideoxy-N-acetyl-beta-L-altrosamine transaminase
VSVIPYGRQDISDEDVRALGEALRDPLITQGPRVAEFEAALAGATGARYAVAFNSGTAALHGAYFAAGVGPARGVLTSPITFAATANAALYLGAPVRFADVDATTALLDPGAVAAADAAGFGVLVPVHLTGQVAPMAELAELARSRGWVLIEDAAHALGARYLADGQEYQVGACAHSAMCCFSFHPVKHITTGEGGAVTTNNEDYYRALKRFRSHGITREPPELERDEGPWYYEQHDLGFNYRLTDLQCALGLSQLTRLHQFVARRRVIARRYDAAFAGVPGVEPLAVPADSIGSYHLYVIRVDAARRRPIFEALREADIGVNVHYLPVYRHPYYRRHGFAEVELPQAERYYAEAISIPMYPGLSDAEQDRVIESVKAQVESLVA